MKKMLFKLVIFAFCGSLLVIAGCEQEQQSESAKLSSESTQTDADDEKVQEMFAELEAKAQEIEAQRAREEDMELASPQNMRDQLEKSSQQPSAGASRQQGRINFENKVLDFGEVGPNTSNKAKFKFKNEGPGKLEITRTKSTCGCTIAKLDKKQFLPGETGVIDISFKAPRSAGSVIKHLFVYSSDSENPKVELEIKARVVLQVKVDPKEINFSLLEPNAPVEPIKIWSVDGEEFAVLSFNDRFNVVSADVAPDYRASQHVITPKINAAALKNHSRGNIIVKLDHPECKMVNVKYYAPPLYKTSPQSIILRNIIPAEPIQREIYVTSNYGQDFEIKSVSSKSGYVEILKQEKTDTQNKLVLLINPPDKYERRSYFADTVILEFADGNKLDILIRGFFKREAD